MHRATITPAYTKSVPDVMGMQAKEREYGDRIREVEMVLSSFTPLVFATTGGMD